MIWRIYWNRPTRYKNHCRALTPFLTSLTRQIWKQVNMHRFCRVRRLKGVLPELDALALEQEEEGPSYLADLNKVPDFVDEPPVEVNEVCIYLVSCLFQIISWLVLIRHQPDKKQSGPQFN